MEYSEENYQENINNKELKFLSLRCDGFGARIIALLNAMYCSKKFNFPFGFSWRNYDITPDSKIDGNTVIGVNVGRAEEIFSADFLQKYLVQYEDCVPPIVDKIGLVAARELTYRFYPYATDKNFCFEKLLYYKCHIPLGWLMPPYMLCQDFKDIKYEYKKICRECWKEIGFSDEFCDIINQIDKAIAEKGKYIALHVRSGDIIYKPYPFDIYYKKALVAELAVGIIVRNLPHHNIVLLGEDITSLERMIEVALQVLKEKNISCNNHTVILAKDLVENNYKGIQQVFYDFNIMAKAEKITASFDSALSKVACLISDGSNDIISCYDYFSAEEQFEIISKYINRLQLHPNQQGFSNYYLLRLAKELGKPFEEQLKYADNMLALFKNNDTKNYVYARFLEQSKKFDLFYKFINTLSWTEILNLVISATYTGDIDNRGDRTELLIRILTSNNVRKNKYLYRIKHELKDFEKKCFKTIYKKRIVRYQVHFYQFIHKEKY